MPIVVPPLAPSASEISWYWVQSTGTVRNISRAASPNVFVTEESEGLGSLRFGVEESKLPRYPGSHVRHINTESRTIRLPIVIHGSSFASMSAIVEEVHEWFDTGGEIGSTPGFLRITRPDGTTRQISCYYVNGLEAPVRRGVNWLEYNIELYAPDPAPTAVDDIVITKTVAQGAAGFTVINDGNQIAYPIWKLTGPWLAAGINNVTTDEGILIAHQIFTTEFLVVDTRPAEKRAGGLSVYDEDGDNHFGNIVAGSKFWTLRPGANIITVVFGSTTTADTEIELTYLPRYRSMFR